MSVIDPTVFDLGDLTIFRIPGDDWIEVEMKHGDGKVKQKVRLVDLWSVVYAMCDTEQQEKMMPVRQTEVMAFKRVHTVMAKKNVKKGDIIRFSCQVNVPVSVVEGLQGLVKEKKTHSGIRLS